MAREVYVFPVTVPAGTLSTSPQVTNLTMPPRVVQLAQVQVPPGPRGEVGFTLGMVGVSLIPVQRDKWIITDDEVVDLAMDGYPDSGAWQLRAYNTGRFAHTLYVRFHVELPGELLQAATGSNPAGVLSNAGTALPAAPGGLPGLPPPPALPPLPVLPAPMPPVLPVLLVPGQVPTGAAFTGRALPELAASVGDLTHVWSVDADGQLHHAFARASANGSGPLRWTHSEIPWANSLEPRAFIAGSLFAGALHVFAPLIGGGILHLVRPSDSQSAGDWTGEVIGA